MTRLSKKQKAARAKKTIPLVPLEGVLSGQNARKLGYARVSTAEQNMDMQKTALKAAGCHHIFAEKVSAKDLRRPQLRVMLKFAEAGDTIFVYAFSRLSRNLKELLGIVDDLEARGINLISTTQQFNPFTTSGRMQLSVVGACDESERRTLSDRTKDGMAEKIRQGQQMGRPRVVSETLAVRIKREYKTNSVARLAVKYRISKSAVYDAINA